MSVMKAAKESRLAALKATRDALAEQIDNGGGTVAQCAAQLRAVLLEIDELEPDAAPVAASSLTDFERRLRERQSSTGKGRAASR